MVSLPLITLLLVASYHCAPYRASGGLNIGGESSVSAKIGGSAVIKPDGLSVTGDAAGVLGGQVQGKAYGSGYGNLNGKEFGARGEVSGIAAGAIEPNFHGAVGMNSKGELPLAFVPGLKVSTNGNFSANGEVVLGEDASDLGKLLAPPIVNV